MKKSIAVLAASLTWALAGAFAQQGNGVVQGRLINGTDPSIVCGGVDLDVVSLGSGMSILKSAVTDAAGKFRLDGLPTSDPLMVRASYKDANYHGRISFDGAGKASVEIEVFEPTTSMNGIQLEPVQLGFQLAGERLRSVESWTFQNRTKPLRTYFVPQGTFRFAKPPGISELPRLSVQGPGSAMPLVQSPLESADGQAYYSLYALRPGTTVFEVEQELPYTGRTYTYRKKFFSDVNAYQIGVIPADIAVAGEGLKKLEENTRQNFSVYAGGPVKAGAEVVWTISGGTPVAEPAQAPSGEAKVRPMPDMIGRNALILGPLFLIALIVVLWFAMARIPETELRGQEARARELRARREQLLNFLADLDRQLESGVVEKGTYHRMREPARRQLRRVMLLLKK